MIVFAAALGLVALYLAVLAAFVLAARRAERRARRRVATTPIPDADAPLYCQACGHRYTHPDPWSAIGDTCELCVGGPLALSAASVALLGERTARECEAWLKERAR